MNVFRTTAASYFCLDENTSGTPAAGLGSLPSAPAPTPAPESSPASGPAATPSSDPATPAAEGGAVDDPFAGLDSDDVIDLGPVAEPGPSPEPAAAPAVTPAPAAPAAPAAPSSAAAVAPAAPAAPAGNAPSAPRSPLEETIDGFTTNAKALADWSAQNVFALSKEEAEGLELDAVGMIPKLMGRVQVEALKGAANLLRNFVPQMISQEVQRITGTQQKAKEALSEFYTANPHLNEKDHGATVDKWAKAYRAANPKASRKEAIDYVGRAVSFEHNLVPGAPLAPKVPPPFAPARPGGRQPIQQQVEDPFAGLDQDFDEG